MGRQKTRQNSALQPQPVAVPLKVQPSTSRTPTSPTRTIQPLEAHIDTSRPIASTALRLHSCCMPTKDYDSEIRSDGSESPIGSRERGHRSPETPLGQMLLSPLEALPPVIQPDRPPGLGQGPHTPRMGSAQWPESQHISVLSTPMSEGARARRREEKRPLEDAVKVGSFTESLVPPRHTPTEYDPNI
jgi:hypothetical protein